MIKFLLCCAAAGIVLVSAGEAGAAAAPVTVTVGEAAITAFQDTAGEGGLSIYRGMDETLMRGLVPSGKMPVTVNVFMIRVGGRTIVVDAGNGRRSESVTGALPGLLAKAGVKPGAIDAVLLTHMHGDHIGGLLDGGKPAFPNAELLVSKRELEFWTDPAMPAKFPGMAQNAAMAVSVAGAYGAKMKTFASGDTVAPGIVARDIAGHTPGHTMFELASAGKRLLFWGDLMHATLLQFRHPEIYATYDMDPAAACAVRRKIMAEAAAANLPVAGAHLAFPAIGRVEKGAEGGFVFRPGLE